MGFLNRLKKGLEKTKENFTKRIDNLIVSFRKIDEDFFEELEEILIESDIAIDTVMSIMDDLQYQVKLNNIDEPEAIKVLLKEKLLDILLSNENKGLILEKEENQNKLNIILVVGVNGTGKTTTIGKLSNLLIKEGKSVILAAGDTFRAAATEQLVLWSQRSKTQIVTGQAGADPASVVYDAIYAAMTRKADVLICDTAGRLHTKSNLMEELKKIKRVIMKEAPDANLETLIVLDASAGQNSLVQAKAFDQAIDIDGIVLTKLDGTAKGGIVISVSSELKIPVKYIGIGEQVDDLRVFDANEFIDALFDN